MVDNIRFNRLNRLYGGIAGKTKAKQSTGSETEQTSNSEDEVEISDLLQGVMQRLLEEPAPAVDMKRIIELKAQYESGEYKPNVEAIATELLNEYSAETEK